MPPVSTPSGSRSLGVLLKAGADWLRARGVEEPERLFELLAASVLGVPRMRIALERDRIPDKRQLEELRRGIVRLGRHEPVQYVLGGWDFRGLTLRVDRRALIPRPETEQLVQLVLDQTEIWRAPAPAICDVGTGSGCIAISLATEAPQGCYSAVDRDAMALALARENAVLHGVAERIRFILGESCAGAPAASLDAVVSNPPYIATATCEALPRNIREFEPLAALDGGEDGLTIVRDIINDAALRLKPQGWCFLEIGDGQGAAVRRMLEQAGFAAMGILCDLSGRVRFARARMP